MEGLERVLHEIRMNANLLRYEGNEKETPLKVLTLLDNGVRIKEKQGSKYH